MSEAEKMQTREMGETVDVDNGREDEVEAKGFLGDLNPSSAINRENEVEAKGFADYLNPFSGKKKTPVESSSSPTNRKPATPSDKEGEKPPPPHSSTIGQHAEEYNMQHKRRGVALLFNHTWFDNLAPRDGTKKDCGDLETQLKRLGFEVRVHNDLKQSKIKTVLEETSKEDHSDADCLVVFVMSHGESGHIFASDVAYREEVLWRNFTGERCCSLRGKPKLFFIQACRGDRVDAGVSVVVDATDSAPITYTIPREADILVAYSTVKEYYAWRSPLKGSWYVQALCEELATNGQTRDLLAILTFVNRRVAVDYISNVPAKESMHMKVQMPTFSSMLTRLVFFRQNTGETNGKRKNMSTLPPAKQGHLTESKQLTKKEEKSNRRFK